MCFISEILKNRPQVILPPRDDPQLCKVAMSVRLSYLKATQVCQLEHISIIVEGWTLVFLHVIIDAD